MSDSLPNQLSRLRWHGAKKLLQAAACKQQRLAAWAAMALLAGLLASGPAAAATLKIATVSPDGLVWMKKFRSSANRVKELTDGRVKFKIYPGGVQGDDATVLRKMRVGQLQGGVVAAGSLTRFYPDLQVYNLPLQFRDHAEVDYVRQRMDATIADNLEAAGILPLGITETGFAYLLSKKPVRSLEDLKQLKAWIPDGDPIASELVDSFAVSPIPLSLTDVLTGLQTGIIDTVVAPPVVALALQWHDQVSYLLDLPLLYIYSALAVDGDAWQKISAEDQQLVRQEMQALFAEVGADTRTDNKKAKLALQASGIQPLAPTDPAQWQQAASQAIDALLQSGEITPAAVQRYLDHLKAYRQGAGAQSASE